MLRPVGDCKLWWIVMGALLWCVRLPEGIGSAREPARHEGLCSGGHFLNYKQLETKERDHTS